MEGRNCLRNGVERKLEPAGGSSGADTGVEFVHLHEGEGQIAEEIVVPTLTVRARPFKPTSESGIGVTGETHEDRNIDAFCQKPEDKLDLLRVGFEIVQRGIDTTRKDFGAGLAFKTLNAMMRTVPNAGMKWVVGDPTIQTVKIGASKSAGSERFLASTATFVLSVRANLGFRTKDVALQSRLAVGTVMGD